MKAKEKMAIEARHTFYFNEEIEQVYIKGFLAGFEKAKTEALRLERHTTTSGIFIDKDNIEHLGEEEV